MTYKSYCADMARFKATPMSEKHFDAMQEQDKRLEKKSQSKTNIGKDKERAISQKARKIIKSETAEMRTSVSSETKGEVFSIPTKKDYCYIGRKELTEMITKAYNVGFEEGIEHSNKGEIVC